MSIRSGREVRRKHGYVGSLPWIQQGGTVGGHEGRACGRRGEAYRQEKAGTLLRTQQEGAVGGQERGACHSKRQEIRLGAPSCHGARCCCPVARKGLRKERQGRPRVSNCSIAFASAPTHPPLWPWSPRGSLVATACFTISLQGAERRQPSGHVPDVLASGRRSQVAAVLRTACNTP